MKKIVSMLLALVMLFGATFCLFSCDDELKDDGAHISVYLGEEVFDFDPTDYFADSNAEQVMSLIYEPLFKINSKGELKCAGAKEYDVKTGKRQIVIKLRESYWSDNVRVKAEDYVYAWRNVLLNSNNANPAAALLYDIENAMEIKAAIDPSVYNLGVEATGDYQITITYREGADYKQLLRNLASVATSPLRQTVVEAAPDYWSKSVASIVTNGPFMVDELDNEAGYFTLARNVGYHQKPTVKNVTEKVTPALLKTFKSESGDVTLTYADIAAKTVFFLGEASLEDRAANKANAKTANDLSTYTYVFNTTKAPFNNANVRRALSLALDREAIAAAVTFGKAANGFLPDSVAKSIYGSKISDRISVKANAEEAQALIAAANIPADQKAFTLTVNDDAASVKIAEMAKEAWDALGFTVTINKVSAITETVADKEGESGATRTLTDSAIQTLVKKASLGEREFDVLALDWQMYTNDAFVALSSFTSNMNGCGADISANGVAINRAGISGWTNDAYDSVMELAYNAESSDSRSTALKNAEKQLLNSSVVIPILYNQNFAFISSDLSGVGTDGFGNFVFNGAKLKDYGKYLPKDE